MLSAQKKVHPINFGPGSDAFIYFKEKQANYHVAIIFWDTLKIPRIILNLCRYSSRLDRV